MKIICLTCIGFQYLSKDEDELGGTEYPSIRDRDIADAFVNFLQNSHSQVVLYQARGRAIKIRRNGNKVEVKRTKDTLSWTK